MTSQTSESTRTGRRMASACDVCGCFCPDIVAPLLAVEGWREFTLDGERDGEKWEGQVLVCKRCSPSVEAGRANIHTFLGGFSTVPVMIPFYREKTA